MAKFVLEILDGDRAGDVVALPDQPLRIGRKPGNDLVLADEKTSGAHAEIVREGDRYLLRDLGSTNGTFLDGNRVTELVLTPGDVVTIGRIRCRFRAEDAPVAADDPSLAMHTLDASRLGKSSRTTGLLAVGLVVALGAGGWLWWQARAADGDAEGGAVARRREPIAVAGNKLGAAIAACEGEDGWSVRAAGAGFVVGGIAHTGAGALEARRGDGSDPLDFAVLRTAAAVQVYPQRTMTLAAHVRTDGAAQAALRAVFSSQAETNPFVFRTGTPLAAAGEWTRLEAVLAVPAGCDRMHLEVVAVLPDAEAAVYVDDCAVVEAGAASATETKLADGGQSAIGTAAALALRSVDIDDPAILLDVRPDVVPAALAALHRADLCVLSDLGATITATAAERGFQLKATGVASLQFVWPAAAAGGLMLGGADGQFRAAAADGAFSADAVLLGDGLTRALLRLPGTLACTGRTAGGTYRLTAPCDAVEVALSFRSERQLAAELVRQAQRARDEGRPGEALDKLREVAARQPMDSEMLAQAGKLIGELLAAQAAMLRDLQRDLDEASFFSTRGGFERVALGVDELTALYGERNLADAAQTIALRDAARSRLAAIDGQTAGVQRQRLQALARAFQEAQQPGLAKLVQDYIGKNLGDGTER